MVGITEGRVFILEVIESIWKIILPNNFHFKDLFVYSVLIRGIKKKRKKEKKSLLTCLPAHKLQGQILNLECLVINSQVSIFANYLV